MFKISGVQLITELVENQVKHHCLNNNIVFQHCYSNFINTNIFIFINKLKSYFFKVIFFKLVFV